MIKTKDLYMQACYASPDIHEMSDDELTKLQSHLRKMYLEIEEVCDRHQLTVMVAFGSALGAVRHNGFIPWDDDIDLLMPRKDYDRLINDYADELPSRYRIFAPNSKNGPIYRFAKVVDTETRFLTPGSTNSEKKGIFVDIFPLENACMKENRRKFYRFGMCFLMYVATSVADYEARNKEYKKLMSFSRKGLFNYYFRNAIGSLFSFRSASWWYDKFDSHATKFKECEHYMVPSGSYRKYSFMPQDRDIYLPIRKVKFDDIEVYIPNQVERHLEIYFGNWQQVPPPEKRWRHFVKEIRYGE